MDKERMGYIIRVCVCVCVCINVCIPKHTYTMEYYSNIKKNEMMPFATTWMDPEVIILSELNQTKTNIIHMWNLI